MYLRFHSVLEDWSLFSESRIHVVFIDAAHDYASVKSDLDRALALPHVHTIATWAAKALLQLHKQVLDDYGTRRGVHRAVSEALQGQARLLRYVGRSAPWSYDGISTIEDWEGVALEPIVVEKPKASLGEPWHRISRWLHRISAQELLVETSWAVFPAGVFSHWAQSGTVA